MTSTKKLAMAALLALGLLALFAGPASAMKYSLSITGPEGSTSGFMRVGGMATDSAGNLYMAQGVVVEKYTSAGKYLMKFTPNASSVVSDVDVDSAGNVWAAAGEALYKFSSTGTLLKTVGTEHPIGVAVDSAGDVFSIGPYNVRTYDSNGASIWSGIWFGWSGSNGHSADIDVNGTNGIWTSEPSVKWIRRHEPKEGKVLNEFHPAITPAGVAADNAGNVWVAEPSPCRVRKYSATGSVLDSFGTCGTGPGQFTYQTMPHERPGIAWGPGGVMWVSNGAEAQKWIP